MKRSFLFDTMGKNKLINEAQQKAIQASIAEAELNTSGEIRVHIDAKCAGDPKEKAIQVFEHLKMHTTAQRNGVLFYVAMADKKLAIGSTANQDNPLMDVSSFKGFPLLGLDVWEHAYYLKYQNKRADYITAWFNLVNWDFVSARYEKAMQ